MSTLFQLECCLRQAYRQGPLFRHYLMQLNTTANLPYRELRQSQIKSLQCLVEHCYRNVPYYTDLFNELRIKPHDITTIEDLQKLPFLDKQTVNANYDKLMARTCKKSLCNVALTSGSTGTPAKFVRDFNAINFEHAAVWRQWRMAGDSGKRRVTLRGDIIVPHHQKTPPFWKYNAVCQELLLSSYHLSLDNSIVYIEKILNFQPKILYCYPSTGYLLARFFQNHQIPYAFDAIFTSSETLEPEVRALLEECFQCKVYDWYGQAERVAAIAECEAGNYHILEDYSIVELPESLKTENGYELVGTHLHNKAMPLLRYRTKDYVTISEQTCYCQCDFRTVGQIAGRNYSYLLTPEGYRISITNHIPRGVDNLIETQFYQEKPGEVVLKVLTNGHFTEKDRERLVRNTIEHTSPKMKVIVKEVSELPRGPNGKFISIVNKLESRC